MSSNADVRTSQSPASRPCWLSQCDALPGRRELASGRRRIGCVRQFEDGHGTAWGMTLVST